MQVVGNSVQVFSNLRFLAIETFNLGGPNSFTYNKYDLLRESKLIFKLQSLRELVIILEAIYFCDALSEVQTTSNYSFTKY